MLDTKDLVTQGDGRAATSSDRVNGRAVTAELEPQKALDALLINEGDYAKTLEQLKVTKAEFVRALTKVPSDTYSTLRLAATIRTFNTIHTLSGWLDTVGADMEGGELARALGSLMGHLDSFTKGGSQSGPATGGNQTVNILLQHMPREAANAIKGVASMDMDDLHDIRRLLKERDGTTTIIDMEG